MTDAPHSILLVEDDLILLRMLADTLIGKGYVVHEARNGVEGMALIAAKSPDLVLLDVDMPQMDGITMLKNLKANNVRTAVLMLTNLNNPDLIADAAELGVSEYLVKSDWEIDAIVSKVEGKFHHNHIT